MSKVLTVMSIDYDGICISFIAWSNQKQCYKMSVEYMFCYFVYEDIFNDYK